MRILRLSAVTAPSAAARKYQYWPQAAQARWGSGINFCHLDKLRVSVSLPVTFAFCCCLLCPLCKFIALTARSGCEISRRQSAFGAWLLMACAAVVGLVARRMIGFSIFAKWPKLVRLFSAWTCFAIAFNGERDGEFIWLHEHVDLVAVRSWTLRWESFLSSQLITETAASLQPFTSLYESQHWREIRTSTSPPLG